MEVGFNTVISLIILIPHSSNGKIQTKGEFPLSRNSDVRTCVKFMFANEIEIMYERSHVKLKVERRFTSRLSSKLYIFRLFYLGE